MARTGEAEGGDGMSQVSFWLGQVGAWGAIPDRKKTPGGIGLGMGTEWSLL